MSEIRIYTALEVTDPQFVSVYIDKIEQKNTGVNALWLRLDDGQVERLQTIGWNPRQMRLNESEEEVWVLKLWISDEDFHHLFMAIGFVGLTLTIEGRPWAYRDRSGIQARVKGISL